MSTLIHIAIVTAAILFAIGAHVRFWRSRYRVLLGAAATHYTRTRDGWRLALHRYPGGDSEPVVLCHGLLTNAHSLDLGETRSLARYLRDRGYDVWSLELRGSGASRRRDRDAAAPASWSFDDHVGRDIPAAIGHVLEVTGKRQLHWVGHSMGGMAMYAYLAAHDDHRVASLCAIGSPAHFRGLSWWRRLGPLFSLLGWLPAFPAQAWAGAGVPLVRSLPISYMVLRGDNLTTREMRLVFANLVEPLSPKMLRQLGRWLRSGKLLSSDGRLDYSSTFERIRIPVCAIAGSADTIAPSGSVRAAYDAVGSTVKEFHLMGRDRGASTDFGHVDLLIGEPATRDVLPLVGRWLAARRITATRPRRPSRPGARQPDRRVWSVRDRPDRLNPYDPYFRRLRRRWTRWGGAPPIADAATDLES